jgi:uncharacterized protein YkwD
MKRIVFKTVTLILVLSVSACGIQRLPSISGLKNHQSNSTVIEAAPVVRAATTDSDEKMDTEAEAKVAPLADDTGPTIIGMQDINILRAENGKSVMNPSQKVSVAARRHAQDMFDNEFMSYAGSDGSSTVDRLERNGCSGAYSEFISRGHKNRVQAMKAWISSPSHLENMLMDDVNLYAVENAGNIWVLLMANRCN